MPLLALPFASTAVASTGDRYVSVERAEFLACSWGSVLVDIGPAGHVDTASGLESAR